MSNETKIISSQRFMDTDKVDEKKLEIAGLSSVEIPCSMVGDIDGVEYAIVVDKHHTMWAAMELGIEIRFVVRPDPEGLTGDNLLEKRFIDSAYYDVITGIDEF